MGRVSLPPALLACAFNIKKNVVIRISSHPDKEILLFKKHTLYIWKHLSLVLSASEQLPRSI